jgi:hypothetical protein
MSSTAPYKSRLLNFLNRQAIRINDKLGKTARYVKVATEWGVQILLYPVYLMVQSGRMAGRQLSQRLQTNLFLSSGKQQTEKELEIPADSPLKAILISISPWVDTEEISDNSLQDSIYPSLNLEISNNNLTIGAVKTILNPDRFFQGVASLLENHHLVLVDRNNQILDILTPEQQQQLQKQIVLEVAVYKYQKRRRVIASKQQHSTCLPNYEINSNRPNITPPARFIWETMNWIQTGKLATSIDLFGESNLVCNPSIYHPENQIEDLLAAIDFTEIATNLDSTLAKIEESAILPLGNKIGERLQAIGRDWQSDRLQTKDSKIEADPFQIRAIILAAIEYFFGNDRHKILAGDTTNKSRSNGSVAEETEEDPWLAWEDLYLSERSPLTVTLKTTAAPISSTSSPSLPAVTMPRKSNNSRSKKIERNLERQKARSIQPIPRKSSQLAKKNQSPTDLVPQGRKDRTHNSLQVDRDYLETKAKPVGYVKHPLEQMLSWLDRTILWLEEFFIAIMRWLKKLFRSNR